VCVANAALVLEERLNSQSGAGLPARFNARAARILQTRSAAQFEMGRITVAVSLIAEYIAEQVRNARGNVVAVDAARVGKWYRKKRFGEELPRGLRRAITYVLKQLYDEGYVERAGAKYAVRRGSALWVPEADELDGLIRSVLKEKEEAEGRQPFSPTRI